jgi:hypothetical protein
MQCERLVTLIKGWYIHVREETMAPARMVSFIKQHAEQCEICLRDPDLKEEIAKITEIVLPESKIPKAVRQKTAQAAQQEEKVEEVATDNDAEDADESNNETEVDGENLETEDNPTLTDPPAI